MNRTLHIVAFIGLIAAGSVRLPAQVPESETGATRLARIWSGITANGDKASFDFRAGFFPNDYNIAAFRGQENDSYTGAGIVMATSWWKGPLDTAYRAAVYGPRNDYLPNGKVIVPLTNYLRFGYPSQVVDGTPVALTDVATVDPARFSGGTYDQIAEVTNQNILGVDYRRRILVWSQSFNDDYIITDIEFTNTSPDTLHDFYISMQQGAGNRYDSYGLNPTIPAGERSLITNTWMHYYGGRVGDTMRVFYEYHADDPNKPGDDMGTPVASQGGRLANSNFFYYAILHASQAPYTDPSQDVDDLLQPRVTYHGKSTEFPNPSDDPYGNKNYWAIRGGLASIFPMSNTWPGTFHAGNNDETGSAAFYNYPGGTSQNNNAKRYCSFGPYTFAPGQKLRIAYASGVAGIGVESAKWVGESWLDGTLPDPPGMPDPSTGWLPSNFAFPADATEMDKRKDRWISMGIDSVMLSAWRATWNFDHGYQIPQAPPPPSSIEITGYGDGVEITWENAAAEARPDFAGHRIMRRVSNRDTSFYEIIYESDAADKATQHFFKDQTAYSGAQYYYYIQSLARIDANDPNADPTTLGMLIASSRLFVPNVSWINPPRFSTEDMSQIRIAPNPYNINDPNLLSYGFTDQRGIIFFNLPSTVTIRIFTENGDLVRTLEHTSTVRAGSVTWDMTTDSQQIINSGVYIAVFEKPGGELVYQKFLVVR